MTPNLATLAQKLTIASREIRILPPGLFRANDGRPPDLPGWKIDAAIAARIVADLVNRDDLVIDYEHQSVLAKQNGQPAPAAGWFNRVVWREGQGLFAVDVKWTDKAKQMIGGGEYRFISPVFSFNPENGHVERLLALGLTNNPGLSGLTDLAQIAINVQQRVPSSSAYLIAQAATLYQGEQAALGIYVSTAQAVAHVERLAGRPMTASLAAADITPPSVDPRPQALVIAKAATEYQDQQAALGLYVATAQAVAHVERRARGPVA